MLALLLASTGAHAYVLSPCGRSALDATVPEREAEDVPVDVRIALVLDSRGCGPLGDASAELTRTEDGEVVPLSPGEGAEDPDATGLVELFPDAPLDPDTHYTLRVTLSDEGALQEVGFTTGTGTVPALEGTPSVAVERARMWRKSGDVRAEIGLTLAHDAHHLSVVQVRDATLGVRTVWLRSDSGSPEVAWYGVEDPPDELCPEVRQIDGAGRATDWVAADCMEVERVGCSAVGGGGLGLVGVLVAGLIAAGRRSGERRAPSDGRKV